MNLLPAHTKLGKVLRAMHNAGPMTAGEIRKKAGLATDTAVTARIRELREDRYGCEIPPAKAMKQLDGTVIYKYHLKSVAGWVHDGLERERRAAYGRVA